MREMRVHGIMTQDPLLGLAHIQHSKVTLF